MRNWNETDLDQIAHLVNSGTPWDVICDLFAMTKAELADILTKRISTNIHRLVPEPTPYQHQPGQGMKVRKEGKWWKVYYSDRRVPLALCDNFADAASFAVLVAKAVA